MGEQRYKRFFCDVPSADDEPKQEGWPPRGLWKKYDNEKMRTLSVALVMAINVGVEPPDITPPRPKPCARVLAWVNPDDFSDNTKAAARICESLAKNFEILQPRARHRCIRDPTPEDMKKFVEKMRINARGERMLFLYNGHGVPRPTANGEIWMFNKSFTQYVPMAVSDVQRACGSPTLYIWECDNAGQIINSCVGFAEDRDKKWKDDVEEYQENSDSLPPLNSSMDYNEQIRALNFPVKNPTFKMQSVHLGACKEGQSLPYHPDMPADLFTSCLTTPVQTSIQWSLARSGRKNLIKDVMGAIPGVIADRRSLLGELHWIFTSVTDTIAWERLDHDLFQRLFRQDLLLASLMRSYFLAERIMHHYGTEVVSEPRLPSTVDHPMWQTWDNTMDILLSNLDLHEPVSKRAKIFFPLGKDIFSNSRIMQLYPLLDLSALTKNTYAESQYNTFFHEQLTSFEVWLKYGINQRLQPPPPQLPVILQVLLSQQAHRERALELLATFLDHGRWAVGHALAVGVFPYVLKLLQSSLKELRQWLCFIWAKILSVDPTAMVELFKECGSEETRHDSLSTRRMPEKREFRYTYFIKVLNDPFLSGQGKIVAAFVVASLLANNYRPVQRHLLDQHNYITLCQDLLDSHPKMLKMWINIGLGRLWVDCNQARWQAIRVAAYKNVMQFLEDHSPAVRATSIFALGSLLSNKAHRNEHALVIAQEIFDELCSRVSRDGAMLVREEMLCALQYIVMDLSGVLANLHRKLKEQAQTVYLEEEEETEAVIVESAVLDTSILSAKEIRKFRDRGEISESSVAIEELLSISVDTESHHSQTFSSEDIAYRETTIKMLKLLEANSFASVQGRTWLAVLRLSLDPIEKIARMAQVLVRYIEGVAEMKTTKASELILNRSSVDLNAAVHAPSPIPPPSHEAEGESSANEEPLPEEKNIHSASAGVLFTVGSPQAVDFLSTTPVSVGGPFLTPTDSPLAATRKLSVPVTSTPKAGSFNGNGSLKKDKDGFAIPFGGFVPHDFMLKRWMHVKEDPGAKTQKEMKEMKKAMVEEEARPHEEKEFTLISTNLIPWCEKLMLEPILQVIQSEGDSGDNEVLDSADATDWAMHSDVSTRTMGEKEFKRLLRREGECFVEKAHYTREAPRPLLSCTHSLLRPHVYMTDGESIEVLEYDEFGHAWPVNQWPLHGGNPFVRDRASFLSVINPHTTEMLISGSTNGIFRVWNPHLNAHSSGVEKVPSLVTAAHPLADIARTHHDCRVDSTLYDWCQSRGFLACTGNVKVCRVWDAHSEKRLVDVQTGRRGAVVAMATELDHSNLIALGYKDGKVHLHDIRVSPMKDTKQLSLNHLTHKVVGLSMNSTTSTTCLLSGMCVDGNFCVWDPRMYTEPLVDVELFKDEMVEMTSMVMHPTTQFVASSVSDNSLRVYDISGKHMSTISPMGHPLLPRSVMAFHPYRPLLTVGRGSFGDSSISLYWPAESRAGREERRAHGRYY